VHWAPTIQFGRLQVNTKIIERMAIAPGSSAPLCRRHPARVLFKILRLGQFLANIYRYGRFQVTI
jgi:hypothetical protein